MFRYCHPRVESIYVFCGLFYFLVAAKAANGTDDVDEKPELSKEKGNSRRSIGTHERRGRSQRRRRTGGGERRSKKTVVKNRMHAGDCGQHD